MTNVELKKLQAELEQLKTVRRAEIAEKLKIARAKGDLSDNPDYDAAKDEQRVVEERIKELEMIVREETTSKL